MLHHGDRPNLYNEYMNRRTLLRTGIALVVGILVGWGIGYVIHSRMASAQGSSLQVRADLSQYKFINPPLYSDGPSDTSAAYLTFTSSLNSYVSSAEQSGKAEDVSVYFRDLNAGRWTGVNENDPYRPSSMLKVLNLMAALVVAEGNSSFLQNKIMYQASDHSDQYYKPEHTLATGEYTVQELLNAMIIDSDNDALRALDTNPQIVSTFNFLYSLFKLPVTTATSTDFMSPKSYSALFRVLYNSSLFPWDLSEQTLNLLSQTSFDQGLVIGVPAGTVVSHKFGENTALTSDGAVVDRELHDCGIIYYPNDPYLLCVMTKGQDFPSLQSIISDISKKAYDFVQSQSGGS